MRRVIVIVALVAMLAGTMGMATECKSEKTGGVLDNGKVVRVWEDGNLGKMMELDSDQKDIKNYSNEWIRGCDVGDRYRRRGAIYIC